VPAAGATQAQPAHSLSTLPTIIKIRTTWKIEY
jgi:hypothetical protein